LKVALGNGDGTFANAVLVPTGTVAANQGAVVDINHDGKLDVVTVTGTNSFTNGAVNVFLGNGNGTFQAGKTFTTGPYPDSVFVTDVNGDGFPDLATHTKYVADNAAISLHLGNGDGTFSLSRRLPRGQIVLRQSLWPTSTATALPISP